MSLFRRMAILSFIEMCVDMYMDWEYSYLRDTLLVLSSEQNSPCDATGVLALKEKGLGFAVLETEDLAVTTDVELSL